MAFIELIAVTFSYIFTKRGINPTGPDKFHVAGNVIDILPGSVIPFRSGKFYLVRQKDGGFLALSLFCTHLGCTVRWDQEKLKFICPCHSSEFDQNGDVINPPAPRAMDYYPVIIDKGQVKVDISRPLKRRSYSKEQVTYA